MVLITDRYILVVFHRIPMPHPAMISRLSGSDRVEGFFIQKNTVLIKFFREQPIDVMRSFAYNERTSTAYFPKPYLNSTYGRMYLGMKESDVCLFLKKKSKNTHKVRVTASLNQTIPKFFYTRVFDLQGVYKVVKTLPQDGDYSFGERMTLFFIRRPGKAYFKKLKSIFYGFKVSRIKNS